MSHTPCTPNQPVSADLAPALRALTGANEWEIVETRPLRFHAHHPQGMVKYDERFYMSTVDKVKETGYMLCFDNAGELLDQMEMDQGACFHPGGFSLSGDHVVVPVAEYSAYSTAVMVRIDLKSHLREPMFAYDDHLGAAAELPTGDIFAATWGSREFVLFDPAGREIRHTVNPNHFVDIQDMQYIGHGLVVGTGLTRAPSEAGIEFLGGIMLFDSEDWRLVAGVPFRGYAPSGSVGTYNPTWFEMAEGKLRMYAVPDDNVASLITWETTVDL